MCAGFPYHATVPVGTIYGAIDRPDGTVEVIGTRPSDYPFPFNMPEGGIIGLGDECSPAALRSAPLAKWTIASDGSVSGPSDFDSQASPFGGFAGVFSPDGNWLAGNLQATTCDGVGLPIIWHPGDDYVLVELPANRPTDRALIRGVANNGTVIYSIDDDYYAWNQATGFTPLRSLYQEAERNETLAGRRITLFGISADGQTIVGTSGGSGELPHRPTVWRNGISFALPMDGYSAGFAVYVSDNGRVIGGNLRDGTRMIPAVWVDGVLQEIPEISGGFTEWPNIIDVDSGLADDPNGWAALGWDSGRVFVVRSDGVIHEFYLDDPDNLGLSIGFAPTIRHFAADGDSLNLVTYEYLLPAMGGCANCEYDLTPRSRGHVYSIPLSGTFNESQRYDFSGDGHVSPIDAVLVINALNSAGSGPLSLRPAVLSNFPGIDLNGDGELSPMDAVLIINYLNAQTPPPIMATELTEQWTLPAADGESAPAVGLDNNLLSIVAEDLSNELAAERKRKAAR